MHLVGRHNDVGRSIAELEMQGSRLYTYNTAGIAENGTTQLIIIWFLLEESNPCLKEKYPPCYPY
jgi:hypothetical protein